MSEAVAAPPRLEHDWEKTNLVTRPDMTDAYECKACKITASRHGLGWPPGRDRKYRDGKYATCPGPAKERPAPPSTKTELKFLPVEKVVPSKTNPRKTFDAKDQEKLEASIAQLGVQSPIKVRPQNGRFEIVYGERRWRAAKKAGLTEIPSLVQDLTDDQALEIQVVENQQRTDVHPLEEAEGYKALLARGNFDVAALADRVGLSVSYVYMRLKLTELIEPAKKAFLERHLTAGHAEKIARLQADDQAKALELCVRAVDVAEGDRDDWDHEVRKATATVGRGRTRMVKVKMDGPSGLRFIQYARWWWERNKGPVPPGKLVFHMDGDELNDDPKNFALGTNGDKIVLAHMRDEEWSREQHRRCGVSTAEHNRFAGKLHRLRHVLPRYWYPVLDSAGMIFNAPFRRRKGLLAWFGVDVSTYPANGAARKLIAQIDGRNVRAVRGRDLDAGILQSYLRVDPEFVVSTGREKLSDEDEERIKFLRGADAWKRAEEAAKKDSRERR